MKILAIETSSDRGSVALLDGDSLSCADLAPGAKQSSSALATIRQLLDGAGVALTALDAIAFGSGPGMFTGLRLGCGVAQGLSIGSGRPLIAVSSLQALAERCPGERLLVATDARMGEVYWVAFERVAGGWHALADPVCGPPEDVVLPAGSDAWRAIGNGFAAYRDRWPGSIIDRVAIEDDGAVARAGDVARIAARRWAGGGLTPLAEALPQYVRNKVALTTRERLERGARG